MTYYEIAFPLTGLDESEVEAALLALDAQSITYLDRAEQPILEPQPGEVRLWSDTLVQAMFESSADPALNIQRLSAALGSQITETARVQAVPNRHWERAWLKGWRSLRFGRRLWICPTAAAPPTDPEAVIVRLDPGLAFGTGTHPTTALCLQVLDSLPLPGRRVIDYGSGSGILGIAALKLGAQHVTAVDLDPQALLATRENAIRNGVSAALEVRTVDAALDPAFCVMANILVGPLLELAAKLTTACEPGGYLVLSGLLKTQAYVVKAAYANDFVNVQVVERDEWCCIHARRVAIRRGE